MTVIYRCDDCGEDFDSEAAYDQHDCECAYVPVIRHTLHSCLRSIGESVMHYTVPATTTVTAHRDHGSLVVSDFNGTDYRVGVYYVDLNDDASPLFTARVYFEKDKQPAEDEIQEELRRVLKVELEKVCDSIREYIKDK